MWIFARAMTVIDVILICTGFAVAVAFTAWIVDWALIFLNKIMGR